MHRTHPILQLAIAIAAAWQLTAVEALAQDESPLPGFRFVVEIEGIDTSGFLSVSGLESASEAIAYRNGADLGTIVRPGRHSVGNVTLRRAATGSRALWNWRKEVIDGQSTRRSISIILLNTEGSEAMRFNLFECWPLKWKLGPLDAESDDLAIEELVLSVERIEVD